MSDSSYPTLKRKGEDERPPSKRNKGLSVSFDASQDTVMYIESRPALPSPSSSGDSGPADYTFIPPDLKREAALYPFDTAVFTSAPESVLTMSIETPATVEVSFQPQAILQRENAFFNDPEDESQDLMLTW
ncbi:hypothetical protein BGZ70_002207, partial [Mortierella alpina]